MSELERRLAEFARDNRVMGKGPLSVVLVLTRTAKSKKPPFKEQEFVTPGGGQVVGTGGAAVKAILEEHDIHRVLAEEGGRTSRGSIGKMREYLAFMNDLHRRRMLDLDEIEGWWVERVKAFFASQPLRLKLDQAKSLTRIVAELIESAFARQRECPGTMVAGAVMQHLVGAILQLAVSQVEIRHNGFSVADAAGGRGGDFVIEDTVIHVTTAPSEALIRKCQENLANNSRPLIITTADGVVGASALARDADIADRIEVIEIGQFVTTNVFEWCGFVQSRRPETVRSLISTYNDIVDKCETDPNLKIEIK